MTMTSPSGHKSPQLTVSHSTAYILFMTNKVLCNPFSSFGLPGSIRGLRDFSPLDPSVTSTPTLSTNFVSPLALSSRGVQGWWPCPAWPDQPPLSVPPGQRATPPRVQRRHIYQSKGNRHSCDNHRGISLLSIAGKVLARVLLNRLLHHLE